jgi:hypothetical protein
MPFFNHIRNHKQFHKDRNELLNLLGRVTSSLDDEKDRDRPTWLIGELLVCTRIYLNSGEHHSFPQAILHKSQANRLIDHIEALEAGTIETTIETVRVLLEQMRSHLQHSDKVLSSGALAARCTR